MENFFKKLDFENTKQAYDTGKNKFWFIEVDIIEHYLDLYDPSIRPFFFENLVFFQKRTVLFELELLTDYFNFLYKNSNYTSFVCFYDSYVKSFLENEEIKLAFFKQFKELFRSIDLFYRKQISFINLIVKDYETNKNKLRSTFDIEDIDLKSISLGCGDLHEDGISTARLDLAGKKVMVKRGQNHTGLVVDLYNIFLAQNGLEKIELSSLDCKDFYYEEYLSNTKIINVDKVMKSLGSLLFVAYLLGLTDLHYDNIMISDDKFIAIDCETIFNLGKKRSGENYDLGQSVYGPFILPFRRVNNYIFSGVGSEDRVFFENKDYILKVKDTGMSLEEVCTKEVSRSNSSLQGFKLCDYEDMIVQAFAKSYLYFINNRERIIKEIDCVISNKNHRILKKSTSEYIEALTKSYNPFLMIDTSERIKFFKNKKKFDKTEIDALMDNFIPTFFEEIKVDRAYYDKFSKSDLSVQIKLIKLSLDFELFEKVGEDKENNSSAYEKDYYAYLYEELIDQGQESFWVDVVNYKLNDKEITELIKTPDTIYAGKSGICLFLLEYAYRNNILAKETKIHKLMDHIYASFLNLVENKNSSCGIYDGAAGIFYLVYSYHKYTKALDIEKLFSGLYTVISNVKFDRQIDIISGQAGLLKLLIFLWDDGWKDEKIKAGISTIQNNLLSEVKDIEMYLEKNKYLGYSHGLVGIVSVLAQTYPINKIPAIKEIVEKLILYLESLMDTEKGIPSTREKTDYYNSWCHGNSGILLGLFNIYKVFKDDRILKLIKKLLEILVEDSAYNFKLCHGNLGNFLICFNVASYFDDFYYKDLFRSKLDLLVRKISKENFKYYNKNIMVGISGLYYWKMLDWDMQEKLDMI